MTDTALVVKGWNLIAEGAATIALGLEAPGIVPEQPAGVAVGPAPAADLDHCIVHGGAWKVIPAGVSKAGKAYGAFAACPERGCPERPTPAWYAAHPLP
jgi:hypothetical protein